MRPSASRPGLNGWRDISLAAVAAALAGLAIAMIVGRSAVPTVAPGFSGLDLDVYRAGAHALGGGHLLYSDAFDAGRQPHLLFTYPPVGALLMWPVAQIPHLPAILCWNVLTLAVLAWLMKLTAPALFGPARPGQRIGPGVRLGAAVAAMSWTTPIIDHLGFGQVNVFLLALCAADCLLPRTRWPRGLLVGAATAVKLTPGLFVVYFLVTRRGRAALTAAASCVAITALTWLAFPVASQDFWLHAVGNAHRIGETEHLSNQSITGMLARAGGAPGWVHLGLIALAAGAGLGAARATHGWGHPQAGFVLAGMTMNMVSPISWMHHFVPLCLALVLVWQAGLEATGRRRRRLLATAATAYALLVARLPYVGDSLTRAGGWVHVLSVPIRESYLLLTIAMMAVLVAAVDPRRRNALATGASAGPGAPKPARAQQALVR